MGKKVLIMGESGTGKSSSMMFFKTGTVAIVNPVGKELPFRGRAVVLNGYTDSAKIIPWVNERVEEGIKSIVIDDFQYILSVPYMNRIHESGWDKWNDFGSNYYELIQMANDLPDDVIVYYMTHTETLENGITTIKLIGKMLREKITIEGLFSIVLRTMVSDGKYYFATQNSGKDTVKTPFMMFKNYAIENNLAYVDEKIRNYYEMDGSKTDDEMAVDDAEVAVPEIEKPDSNGRRSRRSRSEERVPESVEVPVEQPAEQPKRRTRKKREESTDDDLPF